MIRILISAVVCITMNCLTFGEDTPESKPHPTSEESVLGAGSHSRTIQADGLTRKYLVHVPASYGTKTPTPLVLALHGAAMNGPMMEWFTGLNATSEKEGFIVVYPSGTGIDPLLKWNAGAMREGILKDQPDDVDFIAKLLDELDTVLTIDPQRVFACGMSNGGMMCYRLAAELSERIAAIAPVAGTIAIEESHPKRPVPVIHFHGLNDNIVPYDFPHRKLPSFLVLKNVEDSIQTWVTLDQCDANPKIDILSEEGDKMVVTRKSYGGGQDGAEVVLITIKKGGHTWPGKRLPVAILGKSTKNISANDLIWQFFQKHPMKADEPGDQKRQPD